MARGLVSKKRAVAERYTARNHLTNLLFEGKIKKACHEALTLWQNGVITAEDFRYIQSRAEPIGGDLSSEAAIRQRQRLVE